MMFRLSPAGSLALAALLSAAPASAQTPTYRVTEITGAAGTVCAATALNDSGMTAGACVAMSSGTLTAASGRKATLNNLGLLPFGHYAVATAVNSLGVTVGDGDAGDWQPRPFVTYEGQLLNIDPQGGANMRAIGIMDNDIIFGSPSPGGSTISGRR